MQLTPNEILEKLKEILFTMDDTDREKVESATESTRLLEDLGFTSMSMLYMVIIIEETFGIQFDDASMGEFTTVGSIIKYIGDKMQ